MQFSKFSYSDNAVLRKSNSPAPWIGSNRVRSMQELDLYLEFIRSLPFPILISLEQKAMSVPQ